MLAKMMVWT